MYTARSKQISALEVIRIVSFVDWCVCVCGGLSMNVAYYHDWLSG